MLDKIIIIIIIQGEEAIMHIKQAQQAANSQCLKTRLEDPMKHSLEVLACSYENNIFITVASFLQPNPNLSG